MIDDTYKKYTKEARRGVKGEAWFKSLIVDYSIPHQIARENDLGIDFLCEWIYGDRPSGLLFLAQIKTTTHSTIKPKFECKSKLNQLDTYKLTHAEKIDDSTINYWKGIGLPAFLFYIIENDSGEKSQLECYYKRYTPLLDNNAKDYDRSGPSRFFHVNNGASFKAFADPKNEIGGFARDLVIDYVRLSYFKGHIIQLTPRQLGFWPFPYKDHPDIVHVFGEFIEWNKKKLMETYNWMGRLLAQ